MKAKITKKYIKENFGKIYKAGYCDLQDTLKHREPDYYTAGVYGWNADVYILGLNTCLVTGYRPFGNIDIECQDCHAAEMLAKKVLENTFNYKKVKKQLDIILFDLLEGKIKAENEALEVE